MCILYLDTEKKVVVMKLFRVYDGKSYIGSYRTKTAKIAIDRAQAGQYAQVATFRKSMTAIKFKSPHAVEVTETDQ